MPLTGHKEMRELIREVRDRGDWDISRTNGGHLRFQHAQGGTVFASATPSDPRAIENTRAQLSRVERDNRPIVKKKVKKKEELTVGFRCSEEDCGEVFTSPFELSEHVRQEHTEETSDMSNIDKVREFVKANSPCTTEEVVEGTGLEGPQVTTAWYSLKNESGFSNEKPGVYVYAADADEDDTDGNGGRRSRSRDIINFLHKHEGRPFTIEEIALELFPNEYADDPRGCSGRTSTAAARVASSDEYRIERVGRGVYKFTGWEKQETSVEVKEPVNNRVLVNRAEEDSTLYELVRVLADGRLLLESEAGKLYLARELDLEV